MAPSYKKTKGPRPPGSKGKPGGFNPGNVNNIRSSYKGRAGKIKAELIHKAKVKKHYYSELAKQDQEDDTPDFYKEIFAQVDEQKREEGEQAKERRKEKKSKSSDQEVEEKNDIRALDTMKDDPPKASSSSNSSSKERPNRYQRAQAIMEEQERERKAMLEASRKEKEAKEKQRAQAKEKREMTRSKLGQRTQKGQPILSNQIDHILDKLRNEKQ